MNDLERILQKSIHMSLFSYMHTNNPFLDTLLTTVLFAIVSYIGKCLFVGTHPWPLWDMWTWDPFFLFSKKNVFVLEGKKCSTINYRCNPIVSALFSVRFKAVWKEIIDNMDNNPTITQVRDFYSDDLTYHYKVDLLQDNRVSTALLEKSAQNDLFIVSQKTPFLFNKERQIYAFTILKMEETEAHKDKPVTKIDNIEIVLYSYKSSLYDIKSWVDELSEKYVENIERSRCKKQFLYQLMKTKYNESSYECWRESVFNSTCRFSNLFFDEKEEVLRKIDFFLQNKNWYVRKGVPYTLGIGLHGPPGTGKTSFIKSLAGYTGRHIVCLSLKLIKTKRQLTEFFFETVYNECNRRRPLGFQDKIIVIEDIDAQGGVVLDRRGAKEEEREKDHIKKDHEVLAKIWKKTMTRETEDTVMAENDEPLTLDDLLNLWDGIEENTGRILVISSNHYSRLDPALVRPGRIDISMEMKRVTHSVFRDMFRHFYERECSEEELSKIVEDKYSPAEVTNAYFLNQADPKGFLTMLEKNKFIRKTE